MYFAASRLGVVDELSISLWSFIAQRPELAPFSTVSPPDSAYTTVLETAVAEERSPECVGSLFSSQLCC
jgi:hypothetical protein